LVCKTVSKFCIEFISVMDPKNLFPNLLTAEEILECVEGFEKLAFHNVLQQRVKSKKNVMILK